MKNNADAIIFHMWQMKNRLREFLIASSQQVA